MDLPKFTVHTNIVSQESTQFIGTCWEFFGDAIAANNCYLRHQQEGHAPCMRPYHHGNDFQHLGAAHKAQHDEENGERHESEV